MEKEYKNLSEYLLRESTVFDKEEDTNPLFYMWAVLKSVNGKSDDEIKSSQSLKALFKKIKKFCEKYPKNVAALKNYYTPSLFLVRFNDIPNEKQREVVELSLKSFIIEMSHGIQSFNAWRDLQDTWNELVNSEELQTVLSES